MVIVYGDSYKQEYVEEGTQKKEEVTWSKNAPLRALAETNSWIDPVIAEFFHMVDSKPDAQEVLVAVPLHRENPHSRFNPYGLRVVQRSSQSEVNGYIFDQYPEFYTFSAMGVTQYKICDEDGNLAETKNVTNKSKLRGEADFTPLWEWETELFAYCRLMKTHLFSKFPTWMFFKNWSKAAKRSN